MTPKECERIYNEAYRAVYWTAMSLLKNEADAEDVVQDTFVTLLESYDTLQDKTKVVPWLKKICANRCLNRLTRTKTENVEQEFFEDTEYVPEDFLPESIVESAERRKIIMDIIDKSLSEDIRRTIILYYFDEMSTKEIAEAMEIPPGTVMWRLGFARKKIKKEVERYEKETDTKLYSVALPFLALLFQKEAEMTPLRPMPASLAELSASKEAARANAGQSIVSETIRKGTGIAMKKLIILCVGLLGVGAVIVAAVIMLNRDEEPKAKRKANKNNTVYEDDTAPGFDDDEDYGDDDENGYRPDTDPDESETIDVNTFDWESFYEWDGNTITGFSGPRNDAVANTGIMVIPARCEAIAPSAFGTVSWAREVRFETPEKVKEIGDFSMNQFPLLHSFVFPPNADLFLEGVYFQPGTAPFAFGVTSDGTKLHNLVLPNGMVSFALMKTLAIHDNGSPKNNQVYMERLFVPADFSIRYNDPDYDNHCFATFTKEFYDANWSLYKQVLTMEDFGESPCTVYVVKGSWADVNFDDWTVGDLIVKNYWDGVNYTFAEYDPLWDIEDICFNIGKERAVFNGYEEHWHMYRKNENEEKVFDGTITPENLRALYNEIIALAEAGKLGEGYGTNCVRLDCFGDEKDIWYSCADADVLRKLAEKYAK